MLEQVQGMPCPRCGCRMSRVVAETASRWSWGNSAPMCVRACDYCRKEFQAPKAAVVAKPAPAQKPAPAPPPPVAMAEGVKLAPRKDGLLRQVVPCPKCKSTNVRVTSPRESLKHWKCCDCSHPYKSSAVPRKPRAKPKAAE